MRSFPARNLASIFLVILLAFAGCRTLRGRKASEADISAARQLSLQGIDAQHRGQWPRAEALFAAALQKFPGDERAQCGYAEALFRRGERGDALAHMEISARLSDNDPERLVRLGQMYLAGGKPVLAQKQADQAIAANPRLAVAWALRGDLLAAEGRLDEGLAAYHRALSFEPHLPAVQLAAADIYARQNRPQRALATLQSLSAGSLPDRTATEVLTREVAALRALGRENDALAAERLLAARQATERPAAIATVGHAENR